MYCPLCRSEYREGFSECVDCQVPLVENLPPESDGDPNLQLVNVFDSKDPAVLEIAKSILEDAGIDFIDLGEGVEDFFGVGRIGGIQSLTGQTGLLVARERSKVASELLRELDS